MYKVNNLFSGLRLEEVPMLNISLLQNSRARGRVLFVLSLKLDYHSKIQLAL